MYYIPSNLFLSYQECDFWLSRGTAWTAEWARWLASKVVLSVVPAIEVWSRMFGDGSHGTLKTMIASDEGFGPKWTTAPSGTEVERQYSKRKLGERGMGALCYTQIFRMAHTICMLGPEKNGPHMDLFSHEKKQIAIELRQRFRW